MITFEQVYNLDNRIFIVSKNMGYFPVHTFIFMPNESNVMIHGTLTGESIRSGQFLGRFVESNQIELFFQWIDGLSLLEVSGRLWGYICGNPSDKLQMFLNWYCTRGQEGIGVLSCTEMISSAS